MFQVILHRFTAVKCPGGQMPLTDCQKNNFQKPIDFWNRLCYNYKCQGAIETRQVTFLVKVGTVGLRQQYKSGATPQSKKFFEIFKKPLDNPTSLWYNVNVSKGKRKRLDRQ